MMVIVRFLLPNEVMIGQSASLPLKDKRQDNEKAEYFSVCDH